MDSLNHIKPLNYRFDEISERIEQEEVEDKVCGSCFHGGNVAIQMSCMMRLVFVKVP